MDKVKINQKIKTLPSSSGVYLMKDKTSKVIYVGKAGNLRKRVSSYFRKNKPDVKTELLTRSIEEIDYVQTPSEREALLLESSLIRKYNPKYNISLKDDKSFPFIRFTEEEFPAIFIERKYKKEKLKGKFLGPYTSAQLLREAFKSMRKIFPFRTCRIMPQGKSCLYGKIRLCPEPCLGKISRTKYKNLIKKIMLFLDGKYDFLLTKLQKEMVKAAADKHFEEAAELRDQIEALSSVMFKDKLDIMEPLKQLRGLLHLKSIPQRIEAFDISNIGASAAVGSMVSFFRGIPDKNNYRRFKIKTVSGINDFAMLSEVVRRRYKRLLSEKSFLPDLIIIDGGKGQLSVAKKELDDLGLDIAIISIAKKNEYIFTPRKKDPIVLSRQSKVLKFIQRIRDEVHCFAISYHRLRRKKDAFNKN